MRNCLIPQTSDTPPLGAPQRLDYACGTDNTAPKEKPSVTKAKETKDGKQPAAQLAHLRAQETILRMIEGPDFEPGDKIPSERTLSEQLGISRMTVRRAMDDLTRLGVLERRGTGGTHVAKPSVVRPLNLDKALGISKVIQTGGAAPGSRLLFFEATTASRSIAAHLNIVPGTPLIHIKRLRTANGLPFCVESSYLPAARVPGLAAADFIENNSLYEILRQRYGIKLGRREGVIGSAPIVSDDADLLGVSPGINVLIYRIDIFDEDEVPIEHMVSLNHPQRVTFKTTSTPGSASI